MNNESKNPTAKEAVKRQISSRCSHLERRTAAMVDKMVNQEYEQDMHSVMRCLVATHKKISAVAGRMEDRMTTEYELWESEEYGLVCRILGNLRELIDTVTNQLINTHE